jgi:hypothetical protein
MYFMEPAPPQGALRPEGLQRNSISCLLTMLSTTSRQPVSERDNNVIHHGSRVSIPVPLLMLFSGEVLGHGIEVSKSGILPHLAGGICGAARGTSVKDSNEFTLKNQASFSHLIYPGTSAPDSRFSGTHEVLLAVKKGQKL